MNGIVNNRPGDYILTLGANVDPDVARLFERAAQQRVSLRELAASAGVSLSTVWLAKEGRRSVRVSTLRKLQAGLMAASKRGAE